MIPKIKKVELRNVHVNEDVYKDNDLFLHNNGFEPIDASHISTLEDFNKMLLHEPEVAIFGTGFVKKAAISMDIVNAAKKNKIELHILPTADAVKKFQLLARSGKRVVAKLHITC
ncbi:MAG: Mth938-like domain-containing protein [Candidatus Aenigmarchaeota archaeon]|nr:Mth938-like domain-containing protein [Candidatus Aenigmarchaeota archaeon]